MHILKVWVELVKKKLDPKNLFPQSVCVCVLLQCVKTPYPTHFGHSLFCLNNSFLQLGDIFFFFFLCIGEWEEGRKEGRDLFSSTQKRVYFEVHEFSLNKQKGHSFTCREMCRSNGAWTSNALGHGFSPVPMWPWCGGVYPIIFTSGSIHSVVDDDNGSGDFWHNS